MIGSEIYQKIKLGQKEKISKQICEEDVLLFAKLSEDFNPIHIDKNYAKKTKFRKRIVHGMLGASLISAVLGNKLPGRGSIILNQTLSYIEPIYINDIITAEVEVLKVRHDKPIVTLNTICYNQFKKENIIGEVVLKVPT